MKSARAARGAATREAGETTVVEPLPTRDHTENMLEHAGADVRRRRGTIKVSPAQRLQFGEVEVPGDFSSAAPFLVAATLLAGSELTVHGLNLNPPAHRAARRARADGRPHHRLQPPADRRRARRRPRCPPVAARRDDDRRGGGAAARRRAAALRAARGPRARGQRRDRGGRAARQGDRQDRGGRGRAAAARRAHPGDARTASRCAACRRGCAAARSTRAAITGSRCSAPWPGSSPARASRCRGAESAAVSFPGFFDLLDSLRGATSS